MRKVDDLLCYVYFLSRACFYESWNNGCRQEIPCLCRRLATIVKGADGVDDYINTVIGI